MVTMMAEKSYHNFRSSGLCILRVYDVCVKWVVVFATCLLYCVFASTFGSSLTFELRFLHVGTVGVLGILGLSVPGKHTSNVCYFGIFGRRSGHKGHVGYLILGLSIIPDLFQNIYLSSCGYRKLLFEHQFLFQNHPT